MQRWCHIVGTYNYSSGVVAIYIDGDNKATTTTSGEIETTSERLNIGGYSGNPSTTFNGTIDEVQIWNKTLSDEEVSQLYKSNLKKFDSDSWNFYTNQSVRNENLSSTNSNESYTYYLCATNSSDSENCTDTKTITRTFGNEIITANFTNLHKIVPDNNPIGVSITSCGLGNSSNADSRFNCFLDVDEVNYLPSYHL